MRKILSLILCVITVFSLSVCVFADNNVTISYSEDYNSSENTVTVTVSIGNAAGLSSGCASLIFDTDKYSFVTNSFNQVANSNVISEGGKTVDNDYECCCAFMSTAEISSSDCNSNGTLDLCTFKFKVKGSYSAGSFYTKGSDFYKGDNEITVTGSGNESVLSANTENTTKKSAKEPKKASQQIEAEINEAENNENNVNNENNINGIQNNEILSEEASTSLLIQSDNKKDGPSIVVIILVVIAVIAVAVVAVILTKKKADKKSEKTVKPVNFDK